MDIFGIHLEPGQKLQTTLVTGAAGYDLPAFLVCGKQPGKTLLLTAQIHALESNGTPALIAVGRELEPEKLRGNVVILPCVNLSGFRQNSPRRLPEDNFNLNADFPRKEGCPTGNALAAWFIREVFPKVDFICDLHGGSVDEVLSPCLFYPRLSKDAKAAAMALNVPSVIASDAAHGLYSYAWAEFGIPGMILERGWGCDCRSEWIEGHRKSVRLLMQHLGMYDWNCEEPKLTRHSFTKSVYSESRESGLWFPAVRAGEPVRKGQLLGRVEDYFGNEIRRYFACADGFVYYYTAGLSVAPGSSLVAYGIEEEL